MNIAPIADVKARFSAYIKKSQDGPIVVTRNGRAVAVLLNVSDDNELERILLAHSPRFQSILDQAEQRIQATGGMKHEDFWSAVESKE
jgi:prevent-host-death family protein